MKKIISILLVLAMVFSMATVAFAENQQGATTPETYDITITGGEGGTYVAYKLLDVSVSLKTGTHHVDHEGEDHKDTCYNYDYTINLEHYDEIKAILQVETLANGRNELWPNTTKPDGHPELVTDEQIIAYLAYQTGDVGGEYNTMRQVADRIYRAILEYNSTAAADKKINPVQENVGEDNVFTVVPGYWMIVDVTTYNGGEGAVNSLVLVDTVAEGDITINVKTSIPTIEVKVKDIEDSESNTIIDKPWLDTADHDAEDTVPFKVTATLPSNLEYYKPNAYGIKFDIELSPGLTLAPDSVVVYMYETKHKADVDTDMNDFVNADITKFTINTTGEFTVTCENVFDIEGVTKDTAFVVYFEAVLNADNPETAAYDGATIGSEGNIVSATLEYSNDPYDANPFVTSDPDVPTCSKGILAPDMAVVYTYELVINKIDSHNHPLAGATFTLWKKVFVQNGNGGGSYDYVKLGTIASTDINPITEFVWKGLDDGDYKLVEDVKPQGYSQLADIYFSISAEHAETENKVHKITLLDGGLMGMGQTDEITGEYTGIIEKDIINRTGTVLPETGATGTALLIGGGAALIIVAAVFLITRKKMSIYEM
ncbi:MAG: LPXTG cell wall anchor domain-containing protein [Clostridia bacterium]|nr:LPXTG cell wall anchor domain-containing protein [Clostridia bacterium]